MASLLDELQGSGREGCADSKVPGSIRVQEQTHRVAGSWFGVGVAIGYASIGDAARQISRPAVRDTQTAPYLCSLTTWHPDDLDGRENLLVLRHGQRRVPRCERCLGTMPAAGSL